MKHKTIYQRKMSEPGFAKVYQEVEAKLSIGEEIARLRHEKHMTQAELAKKAKTSRPAIARYESGFYSSYNLKTLERIAKALNKHLEINFA
jgi:transcriptional regulator with XRE-family HTH domain